MKLKVDEVEGEKDKNIAIRVSGEDIKFIASEYSCSVYIDEKNAESLAFHIQSIIQDRDIRSKKNLQNR